MDGCLNCTSILSYQTYSGGERGSHSPFPKPIVGAVLATGSGKVLSSGRANYETGAVEAVIKNAGIEAVPLSEWVSC
jgi:hypothetical protein